VYPFLSLLLAAGTNWGLLAATRMSAQMIETEPEAALYQRIVEDSEQA
jgi:hypothetical protein